MKMLKDKFKNIKLLVLDVDGVLTGGEIIYDDRGRELKVFNVKDGLGIFLLRQAGIKTLLLTAKDGKVVRRRAKDMRVEEVMAGVWPKDKMLPVITKKYKVGLDAICFIGDDLIDREVIRKVGCGVAVADAPVTVKKAAKYVTKLKGGRGAVREVIDLIIQAQGLTAKIDRVLKNPR